MTERKLWFVWGGVFTDTTWRDLEPGTEQCLGPFHDERTAQRTWREETHRRVDTAQHRLFVIEAPRPGG
jgi:hypothetical protein